MTYDESEHAKDVYAHFGLAYYLAGVFEAGVANTILYLDFLTRQKQEAERRGQGPFNKPQFEADFDSFLADQHAQTLGNLLKRLFALTVIPEDQKALLLRAKQRRDFIAHHFFRERAERFVSRRGRDQMLAELIADEELFEAADLKMQELCKPLPASIGIRDEVLKAHIDRYMNAVKRNEEPEL